MNNIPEAEFTLSGNDIETIVDSALETLLWSEGEEYDENDIVIGMWDESYDYADATPELRASIKAEIIHLDTGDLDGDDPILNKYRDALHAYIKVRGAGDFGHDMTLTRNGHGAGFWDRGLGDIGDVLTEWAEHLGTLHVFHDRDGMFHAE